MYLIIDMHGQQYIKKKLYVWDLRLS